jgi:hypothetical protein
MAEELSPSEVKKDPSKFVIRVKGEVTEDGQLRLFVEPGPIVTDSVRVHSEPSHTLLAVLVNRNFRQSVEGEAWLAGVKAAAPDAVIVTGDLQGAKPMIQLSGRPQTDNRIAVWVRGLWPDGGDEERIIADGLVGNGDFGFSGFLGSQEWCCEGPGCDEMCVTCNGHAFTCCMYPQCEIFCRHVMCEG